MLVSQTQALTEIPHRKRDVLSTLTFEMIAHYAQYPFDVNRVSAFEVNHVDSIHVTCKVWKALRTCYI